MSKLAVLGTLGLITFFGVHGAGAQTPIPPAPQDFVLAVSQSDHYEMLAAHLAEAQGQDQRVRDFAMRMIQDHERLSEDLRRAAAASRVPVPSSGMSGDQAMLLSGLQGLRGMEFDRAYVRQQELAHAQAIAVEGSFASAGADGNLREAARSALPTIKDHLERAKALRSALGSS